MINRPLVVNLIAAPGSGKSTMAAEIFARLKWLGYNAELISEFAKGKVWEENPTPFKDGGQIYLLGKQFYAMHRCRDNVDVLITDSPLCLCSYYVRRVKNPEVLIDLRSFDGVVENLINSFDNLNYFLNRKKKYNPKGRLQTEEESDAMATEMYDFFNEFKMCGYRVQMTRIDGTPESVNRIVEDVVKHLHS